MHNERGFASELRSTQNVVDLLDGAELLPGGGHQIFLKALNDERAESGCDAVSRVEVEDIAPGLRRDAYESLSGMPSPVHRRTDDGVDGVEGSRGSVRDAYKA